MEADSKASPGSDAWDKDGLGWSKARENRARRAAERRGMVLKRSLARHISAPGRGKYALYDATTHAAVKGEVDTTAALSLDEIEKLLASPKDAWDR